MLPLTPEMVLRAYAMGVFPMARSRDDDRLYWIDPDKRGVIPIHDFHLPRSLRKTLRRRPFDVTVDLAFHQVIRKCAEPTPERPETWINDDILELFDQLHVMGLGHSVECWREGRLVGGLYGLALNGVFFGESMFSRVTDASKVALCELVARLKVGGFALLDAQFITEHLTRFGAEEVPRGDYLAQLSAALTRTPQFPVELPAPVEDVLGSEAPASDVGQSNTQTS